MQSAEVLHQRPIAIDRGRLVLALVLAPLLAPFYSAILFERPWDIPFGLMASYGGTLLFVLPAMWLRHHDRAGLWSFALLGIVVSVPGMLLYAAMPVSTHLGMFTVRLALVIAGWGAASGAAFWLLGFSGGAPLTLRSLFDLGPPDRPE